MILSVPLYPYQCGHTTLSIPFCPHHFGRYHFVQEPLQRYLCHSLSSVPSPYLYFPAAVSSTSPSVSCGVFTTISFYFSRPLRLSLPPSPSLNISCWPFLSSIISVSVSASVSVSLSNLACISPSVILTLSSSRSPSPLTSSTPSLSVSPPLLLLLLHLCPCFTPFLPVCLSICLSEYISLSAVSDTPSPYTYAPLSIPLFFLPRPHLCLCLTPFSLCLSVSFSLAMFI